MRYSRHKLGTYVFLLTICEIFPPQGFVVLNLISGPKPGFRKPLYRAKSMVKATKGNTVFNKGGFH